jgi:hypothetical protein
MSFSQRHGVDQQRLLNVSQRRPTQESGGTAAGNGGGTIPRNESVSVFVRDKFAEMNSVFELFIFLFGIN